jgi:hypothetical protein
VRGDQQAEQEQQGRGHEELRREGGAMVVDLGARRSADRTTALDHRVGTVSADQVLAAHLKPLTEALPRAHLA